MTTPKRYEAITDGLLRCMKQRGTAQNGTTYEPPNSNGGIITTKVPIFGKIVLAFDFDPATGVISYRILEKPAAIPENVVWSRIEATIAECRKAQALLES